MEENQADQPQGFDHYNWGATDAIIGARLNRFQPVIHNECGLSNEIDGKIWRRRFVRRLILPKCHQTVVTSAMMYDLALSSFRVPKDKVAYIKTGVDSDRFLPRSNPQLRAQITSDPSAVIFGYVGSLRPSKNVPMLIKAFAKIGSQVITLHCSAKDPKKLRWKI